MRVCLFIFALLGFVADAAYGGEPWAPANVGLPTQSSGTIFVHPKNGSVLYSTTRRGIFKSADGGKSWVRIDGNLGANYEPSGLAGAEAFAIDPERPDVLYAGHGDRLYKSEDAGLHWALTGFKHANGLWSIAILRTTPAAILASALGSGVYISSDTGATWRRVTGLEDPYVYGFAADPRTPTTIYGAAHSGIVKSTDGGRHWSAPGSIDDTGIYRVAIDPSRPSNLYAGAVNGVYKSSDGGATWQLVGRTSFNEAIAVPPRRPGTVYVGTQFDGLHKSSDGGRTWAQIGRALPNGEYISITPDPKRADALYVARRDGLLATLDGGKTWALMPTGLVLAPHAVRVAFDSSATNVAYLMTEGHGLFRSRDGGARWEPFGSDQMRNTEVETVASAPSEPTTIYVACRAGVFRSTDGGVQWTAINTGLVLDTTYGKPIHALGVDPADPRIVYAAVRGRGVYRTVNGGETWFSANRTMHLPLNVFGLAFDPGGAVWAQSSAGDLRTTDGGMTWTPPGSGQRSPFPSRTTLEGHGTPTNPIGPIKPVEVPDGGVTEGWVGSQTRVSLTPVVSVSDPQIEYGFLSQAFFKSSDGGRSWRVLPVLPGNPWIRAVAVDPRNSKVVLVATDVGVLRSTTGGE